jgi:hypothetical protein
MELLDKLSTLGARMNQRFPNLNRGGCAIYASAIIQALLMQGIEAYARVCNFNDHYTDRKRSVSYAQHHNEGLSTSTEWNLAGVCFDHVVVEFIYQGKKYLYDSDSLFSYRDDFGGMHVTEGRLTRDEIIAIANDDEGDWNKAFDRAKSMGKVKKYVKLEMNVPVIH